MKYYVKSGIHIVEVPVIDFKIVMCDAKKKNAAKKNYCNAGFFASYSEGSANFTLPVGHLICDFDATNKYVKHYCDERGDFDTTKFLFDGSKWGNSTATNQFYGKKVSTLTVFDGSATITDLQTLPEHLDYAIAGVPIMRNGSDVKFVPYVTDQGWDASTLYGTWHIFLGLTEQHDTIYVMGMKTFSGNMIRSAEAYRAFKILGMQDVIKLDGGGSFYMNVSGKTVASTLENRRINTIITFGESLDSAGDNPYPIPTVSLIKGNKYTDFNKWLQWQLNYCGFKCTIDGSFGPATLKQIKAFQKANKLAIDGSVGPATRSALIIASNT